ncbi:MAG: rod shape-determining protein [Lachnospiraceae bacterium]|nr:rod shape-determining protein [Lachnospiraceae bacterium]
MVFGLDIGTRSVVGTLGYKTGDTFHVMAQYSKEHETRSMLDGQIHDIEQVSKTIADVKKKLEKEVGRELSEVCIAAAGRVLKTVTTSAELNFDDDTVVDAEHIYTLEMLGLEKAYEEFQQQNDTGVKFYSVGYTVVKYYLNDYPITSLERHKAKKIGVELIATFLPDEVVDGLYRSVEMAGLEVANLTLEPIAAMHAAVPVMYRMLNIALVDVGAGTSDISVTKDGSIVAYGMIPSAGDEFTDTIAQHCLVDYIEAEKIKIASGKPGPVKFKDIMGLSKQIKSEEVLACVEDVMTDMTKEIADKIRELNGGKSVSAVFVVGGGGKIKGFTEHLAKELGISSERVALRGSEVLKEIDYQFENAKKDSLYVTPIGICLNFYDQRNNFIFVNFNGQRIKLYDNGHLTVADAALQFGFPNEGLFPKRGKELHFTVNGKPHMVRGELGEPAVIKVGNKEVSMNAPIQAGDKITVKESTAGADATQDIKQLPEYDSTITVVVNDRKVLLPKFAVVNGSLQSEFYAIAEGDVIEMRNYYTVKQITDFMDVILKKDMHIYVNNKRADLDTLVYDNFAVIWTMEELSLSDVEKDQEAETEEDALFESEQSDDEEMPDYYDDENDAETDAAPDDSGAAEDTDSSPKQDAQEQQEPAQNAEGGIDVMVNDQIVHLTGKESFIFVDVFDYIDFDLSKPQGKGVETLLNGKKAQYTERLKTGDTLKIYWT